jgi:glutamate/tyrosine decarboxylase-like PLP-dependent enzyme
MSLAELAAAIARDRSRGELPFMVVATAGTTGAGAIDPLARIAELCEREGLWLHVDAAWGGAAVILPELAGLLQGTERADSITFDAHKWLSVPMGAGVFLTRHRGLLERTFSVEAPYVPGKAAGEDIVDYYLSSIQWSRRFIGLKLFLSLAVAGWEGYARSIRHMVSMGELLRRELEASRWEVVNKTPLPLVCWVDGTRAGGGDLPYLQEIAASALASGKAWISTNRLSNGRAVLRACITNFRTGPGDIRTLVETLHHARAALTR